MTPDPFPPILLDAVKTATFDTLMEWLMRTRVIHQATKGDMNLALEFANSPDDGIPMALAILEDRGEIRAVVEFVNQQALGTLLLSETIYRDGSARFGEVAFPAGDAERLALTAATVALCITHGAAFLGEKS